MSMTVYNTLTRILLYGAVAALGLAAVYFIAAIVGWRGPYRKRRLLRAVLLLVAFPLCVATQQTLLWRVYLPSLGRAARGDAMERRMASSVVHVGDPAPSFKLTDTDGNAFSLEDLRGKVVVVNFFATWCGPCLRELPHIQEIWNQHHQDNRFALVVIGREETAEAVSAFRSKYGYTFPMAPDPDRAAYSQYAH